jgi:hypothetical protein
MCTLIEQLAVILNSRLNVIPIRRRGEVLSTRGIKKKDVAKYSQGLGDIALDRYLIIIWACGFDVNIKIEERKCS